MELPNLHMISPRERLPKLRDFLVWLITPHNEEEAELFRQDPQMIDEQVYIMNRLQYMSEWELVSEINMQLAPSGLALDIFTFSDN